MALNDIQVRVSNSQTTGGKLVTAGYILLKHPTMTHRHRYLQYLRSRLPEATPFFDILFRRIVQRDDQSADPLGGDCGDIGGIDDDASLWDV